MRMDHYMSSKEPATALDCKSQLYQVRSAAELESSLQRHVATTLGLDEECVKPSTRFVEDLGLEVLGALEVVLSLEAILKIQLPDAEAAQVNSVKDFLDSLSKTVFTFIEDRYDIQQLV